MSRKRSVSELIRLALIYAVQDRESMADCCHDGPDRDEANALAQEFRDYHRKRFGGRHLNQLESILATAKTVGLDELRALAVADPKSKEPEQ
jgi:hypothetical protein